MDIPHGGQNAQSGSDSRHKRRSSRPLPVPPPTSVDGLSVVAQPMTSILQMDFPPGMVPIALPESPIAPDVQASQPRTPTRSPKTPQQHHRTWPSADSPLGVRLRTTVVEPYSPARSDTSHGSEASLIVIGEGFLLPSTIKTPPSVGRLLNARRDEFHRFNPVPYVSETSHAYMLGNASAPVLPAIELTRITAPPPTREGSPSSTSIASSSISSPNPSMENFPSYSSDPVVSLRFPYYASKPLSPIQERTSSGRRTSPSPRGPRPPRPFPVPWGLDHLSHQNHRGSFSGDQQGVSPSGSQGRASWMSRTPPMLHRFNTSPLPSDLDHVPLQEQRRSGMNVHASVFEPSLQAPSHPPARGPPLYRANSLPDLHSNISSAHQSRRGSLEDPHLAAFQSYPPSDEMTELLSAWYMNTFVPEGDGHSQLERLRAALFSMQLPQSQHRRPSLSGSASSGLPPPPPRTELLRVSPSRAPSLHTRDKNAPSPMPVPALLHRMEDQPGTLKSAARPRSYDPHPQQLPAMNRPQFRSQHRLERLQALNFPSTHDTVDLTQDLTPIELPEHPASSLDVQGKIFPMQVARLPDLPLNHLQANDTFMACAAGGYIIDSANPEKSAASSTMQGGGSAGTLVDRGKTTLTPVTERSEPLSAQPSPSNGISGSTAGLRTNSEVPTRRGSWRNQRSWRKGRNRNRSGGGGPQGHREAL